MYIGTRKSKKWHPTGSVLSPTLFNIMLNGLKSVHLPNIKISIYSDDNII